MSSPANHHKQGRADSLRMALLMAPVILGLYLLQHPNHGLGGDARLYTLLALDQLHPGVYGNDLFLRFGSQGSYTLFSPLYAWCIWLLGVEPAASLLNFTSAMAILAAAWWLARACMPPPLAWLATGLVAILPLDYGSGGGFTVLENFITPRGLAEALVLLALGAWLRDRKALAIAAAAAGLLVHPLMALPGAALLLLFACLPHWRRLWPLAAAVVLLAAAAAAGWLPLERWRFDAAWSAALGAGQRLQLRNWAAHDWTRVAIVFTTLGGAGLCLEDAARRLAGGVLLASAVLLLFTWLGSDLLGIGIVVQAQPWRVMWIATAAAVLLLPALMARCWNGPPLWQAGGLLLAAAWVIGTMPIAWVFLVPALLAFGCGHRRMPQWFCHYAPRAAGVALGVVTAGTLAVAASDSAGVTPWMSRLAVASQHGLLPVLALLAGWLVAILPRSGIMATGATLAVAAGGACLAVAGTPSWLHGFYTPERVAAFSPWREAIPPGNDVLWSTRQLPASPAGAWLLLQRPSYFSSIQANSRLFSRAAAMEVQRRADTLPAQLPIENPFNMTVAGNGTSALACADVPVRYVVADIPITGARAIDAPASLGPSFNPMKLYICP